MSKNKFRLRSFLLGTLIGSLLTALAGFIRRILLQPRLVSKAIFPEGEEFHSEEARAYFIASENLRSGVHPRQLPNGDTNLTLHAGYRNFREIWARDFSFASYGLFTLKEHHTIRDTLEAFYQSQRPDGQLPVKLHSANVITRYLHSFLKRELPTLEPLKPKYLTGHRSTSLDGQALLIIASLRYLAETDDGEFARTHWDGLVRALGWLEAHRSEKGPLIHQGEFADWADSVNRRGPVLYTNVIYWKALREVSQMAISYGSPQEARHFSSKSESLKRAINQIFWHSELKFYVTNPRFHNLSSGGNLLAIAWGLADRDQANQILDSMRDFNMADPVPTKAAWPPYPKKSIAIENRLGGLANYHTNAAWLWLGAWHAIALCRTERIEEAEEILARMAGVIVRDGEVHEVFGRDGHHLSSFWYTSEAPLTWSAGMIVYAYKIIQEHLRPAVGLDSISGRG